MNGKNPDYEIYHYSAKEIVRYVAECAALCCVVDYLFYKTPWVLVAMLPFSVFYLKWKKKQLIRERKRRLNYQFRDALNSMSVAIQAILWKMPFQPVYGIWNSCIRKTKIL